MRPKALLTLLESVNKQILYPNEILIIDASINDDTKTVLQQKAFNNLTYYQVDDANRGLTKQRNFGISKVSPISEIICFLDDDTIITPTYFEHLLGTYTSYPNALAVGGYITNEVNWKPSDGLRNSNTFYYDGWMRQEPLRFKVRRWFGLQPNTPPCFLPSFSHGRSVSFLPPSGKVYEVEHFMGGVSSYKKEVFKNMTFSSYFEGYGLYEDADFCFRLAKKGSLYVNTAAQLTHHHETFGRPNKFKYGQMVLRNGWYIWKVKYPNSDFKSKLKWHSTALLLMSITFMGLLTTTQRKSSFQEGIGRFTGWVSLFYNPPKVKL